MKLSSLATLLSQASLTEAEITGFCIDTRQLAPGNVFIAIKGEQFDGHDFVAEAQRKGALVALVTHSVPEVSMPQWIIADPIATLATIAKAHRQTMHCPIVALTGSNGKTTVKEMIAAILPKPAHATKGNLNNHLGAPLSVLQLQAEHRYAVFELGANHLGEIAHTVAIVSPKVALINNIAPAHVEGFGSIEGVARAKGEIYAGLDASGIAVVNDDDAYAHYWDDIIGQKQVVRFSATHPADVYAKEVHLDEQGCAQFSMVFPEAQESIQLQVPGEHSVRNALAAAACCFALGIATPVIAEGLNRFGGVPGRLCVFQGSNRSTVIDDTYNANLHSVLAALAVLSKRLGEKIFIFGDMGELGHLTSSHHSEVGQAARKLGIDQLMSIGQHSSQASEAFGSGGRHFEKAQDLVDYLRPQLQENTTVLVKGSRASAMEKIVEKLLN